MAQNELVVGEPRLGWFIDGNEETDSIAVMLRDTGKAIELTVPLQGMFGSDDPYSRWWAHGIMFADDPDRAKHSYRPPKVLLMHDHAGAVTLVGCRATGWNNSFQAGRGQIVANYAVLGGQSLKYDRINGLRTEVPALAAWTRLSSMKVDVTTDKSNRVQSVQMTLTNAPEVKLARPLNLTMKSTWRTENPRGSFLAYEGVKLETHVAQPRGWDDHLKFHGAVLDLVSLAAWRPFGFATVEVLRADDPVMRSGGTVMSEKWSSVATHRLPRHEPWANEPRFLFPWIEIGPRGVARWLKLRADYYQAVGPLLSVLRSDHVWSHASAVQSGIALEALGYLIDTKKNASAHLNSRKQMNFKPALQVILDDLAESPFTDTAGWIGRADDVYMGAKHPDRPQPDSLVMLNTLRENLLVLRYWIAQQLGATANSLRQGLATDPLASEFEAID
ncbi:hypothetical protein BN12_110007 [Nostocoides japonicum T1-X7]|uniref:ApeA N-terminal domain-containing protein n=1 Tax=Nostocoides japonicum T1-X7 TaxID=1194083 RepID=A0A077LT50_9MICO|nr:HEPN domain-containing protein [Tetrasphaera japonica]CCH76151.1 hypothetical protein BN12_110007 [Tetrasphaera japonica T1-X7]